MNDIDHDHEYNTICVYVWLDRLNARTSYKVESLFLFFNTFPLKTAMADFCSNYLTTDFFKTDSWPGDGEIGPYWKSRPRVTEGSEVGDRKERCRSAQL